MSSKQVQYKKAEKGGGEGVLVLRSCRWVRKATPIKGHLNKDEARRYALCRRAHPSDRTDHIHLEEQ